MISSKNEQMRSWIASSSPWTRRKTTVMALILKTLARLARKPRIKNSIAFITITGKLNGSQNYFTYHSNPRIRSLHLQTKKVQYSCQRRSHYWSHTIWQMRTRLKRLFQLRTAKASTTTNMKTGIKKIHQDGSHRTSTSNRKRKMRMKRKRKIKSCSRNSFTSVATIFVKTTWCFSSSRLWIDFGNLQETIFEWCAMM